MPKLFATSPRWRKIWVDLRKNLSRTILVVLSITVGIIAIGSISGTSAIVDREIKEEWADINPASAQLVSTIFDASVADEISALPEVDTVQLRRSYDVRAAVGDEFKDVRLFSVPDYEAIQLNKIAPEEGAWPPPDGTILVERAALDFLGTAVGQTLTLELPTGESVDLTVEGTAYDLSQPAASVIDLAAAYVSLPTMQELSGQPGFNNLQFTVAENADDETHITEIANRVRDTLESQGQIVFTTVINPPGEPPSYVFIVALLLVLGVVGSMTFLLSGFLIVNIVSALLTQQTRQIGVMKAVGGTNGQIMRMYLGMAAAFGFFALLIGLPLSFFGARGLASFIGQLNNFNVNDFSAPWWVFALQIAIGLAVPVLAALIPVWAGTRTTVRAALDTRGISSNNTIFDRIIARFGGLPRPVLLSFRNTFRQKGRLTLTLITLALAGAIFATVFTVRNSLYVTLDDALGYDNYDVQALLNDAYPRDTVLQTAQNLEGVESVEGWSSASGRFTDSNGEPQDVTLAGLPYDTQMIQPIIKQGRWLEASDTNAVVINDNITAANENIGVGDEIAFIIRGQEVRFEVVGIAQAVFSFENNGWVPYETLTAAIGEEGLVRAVRVTTSESTGEFQNDVASRLSDAFAQADTLVESTSTRTALEQSLDLRFNTLVYSLLLLAGLLAVVGGLGIAGTTSINVLERLREIGVMRSVGAVNYQILGIFITEALFVGVIGWVLGAILALPISKALSDGVGLAFSNAPLTYQFDVTGALLWLVLALFLALVASYLPARRASQTTLREVLAYEG